MHLLKYFSKSPPTVIHITPNCTRKKHQNPFFLLFRLPFRLESGVNPKFIFRIIQLTQSRSPNKVKEIFIATDTAGSVGNSTRNTSPVAPTLSLSQIMSSARKPATK